MVERGLLTQMSCAEDANDSNFILLQVKHILSVDEKKILANHSVMILEYVAENTFLCRYEPKDLQVLRGLTTIVQTANV